MNDLDLMQGIQGEAKIQESRIHFIFLLCILSCLSLSCVWCVQLWSDTTISQCSELRPGLDAGHRHGAEMETEFLKKYTLQCRKNRESKYNKFMWTEANSFHDSKALYKNVRNKINLLIKRRIYQRVIIALMLGILFSLLTLKSFVFLYLS